MANPHNSSNDSNYGGALHFIENKGQWDKSVAYRVELREGEVYVTNTGLLYHFFNLPSDTACDQEAVVKGHAYRVVFEGAQQTIIFTPSKERSYYHNYFIGSDATKWAGGVKLYGELYSSGIYKGIDLKLYSTDNASIKYDFLVQPEANPDQIKLRFEGVEPTLTLDGHISIQTETGEVIEHAPISYQLVDGHKVPVKSKYNLEGNLLTYAFPEGYDRQYPLIIDPSVIFATFSGGVGNGYHSHSTTFDSYGNVYAANTGYNGGWPATAGAYLTNYFGRNIAMIGKYSADGSTLIYATYFGAPGEGNVHPNTLRVNSKNELFLAGNTSNPNLPITAGAYQSSLNGESDIYIARLSEDGTQLISSTYIGGSFMEAQLLGDNRPYPHSGPSDNAINPVEIAFDTSGHIWVTSNSFSTNFPVTPQAHQPTTSPYDVREAVLFKMTQDLNDLVYSTYLGGRGWDGGIGLEYNPKSNQIAVVGYTESSDFYVTNGAYITTPPTFGVNGFVLLMNNQTYQIVASSYLGTTGIDIAMRVAFDCEGNVYVAGRTTGNYPVTVSGIHNTNGNIFVDKLSPDLSTSLASLRTGAIAKLNMPTALAVDPCGHVLLTTIPSNTSQLHQALTPDALVRTPRPFYFAAFSSDLNQLLCGSYFGYQNDYINPGTSRIDPATGIIYHGVTTYAHLGPSWPVTPGAFSTTYQSQTIDQVIFKISYDLTPLISTHLISGGGANSERIHAVRGCKPAQILFQNAQKYAPPLNVKLRLEGDAINGIDYERIPDSIVIYPDRPTKLEIKPLLVSGASVPDPKHVVIHTLIPCGCEDIVISDTVWIYDSLYVEIFDPIDTVCIGTEININAAIDSTLNFIWSPLSKIVDGSTLSIRSTPDTTTLYKITVFQPGAPPTCPSRSAIYLATVEPFPQFTLSDTTSCPKDSLQLQVEVVPGGIDYRFHWSPDDFLRNDYHGENAFFAPPGSYKKIVTVETPGAGCSATDSFVIHIEEPFRFQFLSPSDTSIAYGDSIQLKWEGNPIVWYWTPVKYFLDAAVAHPWVKPKDDISYLLIGWDRFGCSDSATFNVRVNYEPLFFAPTAFTPNGDGKNDLFKITNIRFEKLLHFTIWNRYGQIVFDTKDKDLGWDGNVKGVPAAAGVYFYSAEIVLPDGAVKRIKGDVTLVR